VTLRARVLSLAVGAATVVLVLFAVPLWLLEQRAASSDLEDAATVAARGVADYVSAGGSGSSLRAYVERVDGREDVVQVAVVDSAGTTYGPDLPGASANAKQPLPGGRESDGDRDQDGFLPTSGVDVDRVAGGRLVRIGVTTDDGPAVVLAYAADDEVTAVVTRRLLPLGAAALLVLLLVGAAAEFVSRRLVRDLDRTADLADTIAEGDAITRIPETGPPEVRRLAGALNELAGRIDELLAAERETVADMSHRLRTPLMALRLDVEALPPGEVAVELEQHVTTLERTLTAVIDQARRSQREGMRAGCLPSPVVTAAVEFWRPLVEDQGRSMAVDVVQDLPQVHCAGDDLRAAVDALVENCIAHTPDGTPVEVRALLGGTGAARRVVVEVRDRGPGLPAGALRRGRSDRGSSGLGLDIARGCARSSGGDLVVEREQVGEDTWTVVRLELGLAGQAAHRRI
jgi:signal transduction histidine kinase